MKRTLTLALLVAGLVACGTRVVNVSSRDSIDPGGDGPGDAARPEAPPLASRCSSETCLWGCVDDTCAAPISLGAGQHHTCVLTSASRVMCWGRNDVAQLGVLGAPEGPVPRPVPLDIPVGKLTAGGDGTCAQAVLGEANRWVCWGRNHEGQLGVPGAPVLLPTRIAAPETKQAIALGPAHSCLLDVAGAAHCAGVALVTMTDGDGGFHPAPTERTGFAALVVGDRHACGFALDETHDGRGVMFCWGNNQLGQLGPGGRPQDVRHETLDLPLDEGIVAVAGALHTCHLGAGMLRCHGDNSQGQLGAGVADPETLFVSVVLPMRPSRLHAGSHHTCAWRETANELWCWGANDSGQISAPPTEAPLPPTRVPIDGRLVDVALGHQHTCALVEGASRNVICWGANQHGQCGQPVEAKVVPAIPLAPLRP